MKYICSLLLIIVTSLHAQQKSLNFSKENQTFIEKHYGTIAIRRLNIIQKEINQLKENQSYLTKLQKINILINKFHYKEDIYHWKKVDYWSSLIELIGTGMGDGEDFAMSKLFILTKLGFQKSHFILLKNTDNNEIVLGYQHRKNQKYIVLTHTSNRLMVEDINFNSKYIKLNKSSKLINDSYNRMLENNTLK